MRRADFSAEAWEGRVLQLLSQHPDTVSLAGHVWTIRQGGVTRAVPFIIAIAAPGTHEVRFEVAELLAKGSVPGAALSEEVQLIFVCSPESHSMLTLPAHELRELIARKGYPRSVTPVGKRDARGIPLSERVLVPLADLAALPGATVSHPESW